MMYHENCGLGEEGERNMEYLQTIPNKYLQK